MTLDYGAPPGCIVNGVTISGSVTMAVTKGASGITVDITFNNLVVQGTSVAGTLKMVTSNGTTFTCTVNLTSGEKTITGNVTLAGASGVYTLTGTLTTKGADGASQTATITNLKQVKGACYPEAGTVEFKSSSKVSPTITVTFLSTTPKDGKVSVKKGATTSSVALPAYGSCPPPP